MGDVPVDREALGRLVAESPQVQWLDEAHRREHSLEMHLPFLLKKFNMIPVVPLVVGGATAEEVAAVLEQLWSDDTLFVVSSDLSHFHDYETAKRVDGETTRRLERLAFDELDGDRACGFYPLRGLLLAARRKGLGLRTVDLRSSGDTAGSRREVVGYGSYLLG
jgi:AmmeMemoRadiSam system protein B